MTQNAETQNGVSQNATSTAPVAPAVAPMAYAEPVRQSIMLPEASCDLRIGVDALYNMGREMRLLVGVTKRAALICSANVSDDLAEELRRQIADTGFRCAEARLAPDISDTPPTLDTACEIMRFLSDEHITADDILVFAGAEKLASIASYVSNSWCAGTEYVFVPTSMLAAIEGITTPAPLSASAAASWSGASGASSAMPALISTNARPRMAFCDVNYLNLTQGEQYQTALVYMVSTALCDNSDGFSRLAERVDAIASHDQETLLDQLVDTIKSRGYIEASSSVAVRQANTYGMLFELAFDQLFEGVPRALKRAEGLRISARLAVGLGEGDIDLVYGQDAALQTLGIGQIACDISADELIGALKRVSFARANRFVLPLPLAEGRVRYTAVPDELLQEHLQAWCASRKQLLQVASNVNE